VLLQLIDDAPCGRDVLEAFWLEEGYSMLCCLVPAVEATVVYQYCDVLQTLAFQKQWYKTVQVLLGRSRYEVLDV
jgi:hypothetical protein